MSKKDPKNKHRKSEKKNDTTSSFSRLKKANSHFTSSSKDVHDSENTKTNMEAYHPHSTNHKRKFKDLLVEFIMMFIAITGGFFMENIREHRVDRHKEKEYMVRLVGDIKTDTVNIKRIIQNNDKQMKGLDSLLKVLEKPAETIRFDDFNDLMAEYLNNYKGFSPRDITITQLKNSGGLRLIEDNSVSDSIVNYYSTIEHFHELNVKLNYRFIEDTYKLELQFIEFSPKMKNKKLSNSDVAYIKELRNRCLVFKTQIGWDNVWLSDYVRLQGVSLLHYLKKEYQIQG